MKFPKIKEKREELGYTQKQVAEILDLPPQTFINYELGIRTIKIPILKKLAILFKCSVDELI